MNDFKALRLENGDQIRFLADRPGDTIMVEAQGAIRGASRFPVRRSRLPESPKSETLLFSWAGAIYGQDSDFS